MIIYPGNDKPVKMPTAPLYEIALFPVFQTREDYAERNVVTLSEKDWRRMEALLKKYLGR